MTKPAPKQWPRDYPEMSESEKRAENMQMLVTLRDDAEGRIHIAKAKIAAAEKELAEAEADLDEAHDRIINKRWVGPHRLGS